MSFGLQVKNEAGNFQFDSNTHYNILQMGTANAAPQSGSYTTYYVNFPTQSEIPLVFICSKRTETYAFLELLHVTTSSFVVRAADSAVALAFDYVVLTRSPVGTPASSGFGLETYNASGQLSFNYDTAMFAMDVFADIGTLTPSDPSWFFGDSTTVTLNFPAVPNSKRYINLNFGQITNMYAETSIRVQWGQTQVRRVSDTQFQFRRQGYVSPNATHGIPLGFYVIPYSTLFSGYIR